MKLKKQQPQNLLLLLIQQEILVDLYKTISQFTRDSEVTEPITKFQIENNLLDFKKTKHKIDEV